MLEDELALVLCKVEVVLVIISLDFESLQEPIWVMLLRKRFVEDHIVD